MTAATRDRARLLEVAAGLDHRNGNGLAPPPDGWPAPLGEAAFHGAAGDVVRAMEPHTEADAAALLLHLLAGLGIMVGRNAKAVGGGDDHHLKLFVLFIGRTSDGRKGTAWGHIKRFLRQIDETFVENNVGGGISTGEGLIYHVRDAREEKRPARKGEDADPTGMVTVLADAGVDDKRILCIETEFGLVFARKAKDGSSTGQVLQQCWDDGYLSTKTRGEPMKATGAHVGVLGHITPQELEQKTSQVDEASGFLNRFLFCATRRSKFLPDEEPVPTSLLNPFVKPISEALRWAESTVPVFRRDEEAGRLWNESLYRQLTSRPDGRVGLVTNRAAPYVVRLAALYALLDQSWRVRVEHLLAALEVWRYCDDSAHMIFGGGSGNPDTDRFLAALRQRGALTKTDARLAIGKNKPVDVVDAAIARGIAMGYVDTEKIQTAGAPTTRYVLVHRGLAPPFSGLQLHENEAA